MCWYGRETEHWLRCCAGTSSPLCSSLEESGDLGRFRGQSLCHCRWTGWAIDACCRHRSYGSGQRSGWDAERPLWLQKAMRRDSFVCVVSYFYTYTCTHVCTCVYLETAWVLHFICGRSITILVFIKLCPLTGEAWIQAASLFCMLESWDYKTSYSIRGVCVCVCVWGRGLDLDSISQLPVVWYARSLLGSLSQAVRQQLYGN